MLDVSKEQFHDKICSDSSKQELFNASNECHHSKSLLLCGSVEMNAVKYEPGPSSIGVMRMERMRRAAPERQKGLDGEWAERRNERRPQQKASMQGAPPPAGRGGGL